MLEYVCTSANLKEQTLYWHWQCTREWHYTGNAYGYTLSLCILFFASLLLKCIVPGGPKTAQWNSLDVSAKLWPKPAKFCTLLAAIFINISDENYTYVWFESNSTGFSFISTIRWRKPKERSWLKMYPGCSEAQWMRRDVLTISHPTCASWHAASTCWQ